MHKTETANRRETTNSKLPGPIIMIHQSETGNSSQSMFFTVFCAISIFNFSSSNFNIQGHILSTTGIILVVHPSFHHLLQVDKMSEIDERMDGF